MKSTSFLALNFRLAVLFAAARLLLRIALVIGTICDVKNAVPSVLVDWTFGLGGQLMAAGVGGFEVVAHFDGCRRLKVDGIGFNVRNVE
jgi:hypothetical protein